MTEDEQLNEVLAAGSARSDRPRQQTPDALTEKAQAAPGNGAGQIEWRQWQMGANDTFRPAGVTREHLPPAVYTFGEDQFGLFITQICVVTDSLVPLPDTANARILDGMKVFWKRRAQYVRHGLLYKRGILLWGPPGGGKTATLQLLSQQIIADGGAVILCENPHLCSQGLRALRRIEPSRPLICVMEDVDEIIERFGEHAILALLDGENQVDRIVHIATTNYPERLGARIVNRPSRFDERIMVGMPSAAARQTYLSRAEFGLEMEMLARWVADTDGLSIAHLRELAAAVLCLGQSYDIVLARLKTMRHKIRERDAEPGGGDVGFR